MILKECDRNEGLERQIASGFWLCCSYDSHRMGRFMQTDPIGYTDSYNLYQSFNQNPINFVDPMGLFEANLLVSLEEIKDYNNLPSKGIITEIFGLRQLGANLTNYNLFWSCVHDCSDCEKKFKLDIKFFISLAGYYYTNDYYTVGVHEKQHQQFYIEAYYYLYDLLERVERRRRFKTLPECVEFGKYVEDFFKNYLYNVYLSKSHKID